MVSWRESYVSDTSYPEFYFLNQSPVQLRLPLLLSGFAPPNISQACELGFGQGLSLSIHASSGAVGWFGNDFSATHVLSARRRFKAAGLNENNLFVDSFSEFAEREDLPLFDYVVLHGVWSWVSDASRNDILKFIQRRLNVGGLLYISYNCLPGWHPLSVLQEFISSYVDRFSMKNESSSHAVLRALEVWERFEFVHPRVLDANPGLREYVSELKKKDPRYIAHELLNKNFCPFLASEVSEVFSDLGVSYAGSSQLVDYVDALNFTKDQLKFFSEFEDVSFQQMCRDYSKNQRFRADLYLKGGRRLGVQEQISMLLDLRFVALKPATSVYSYFGALGETSFASKVDGELHDFICLNGPVSVARLKSAFPNLSLSELLRFLLALSSSGFVALCSDDKVIEKCAVSTLALNDYLVMESYIKWDGPEYLASPLIAAGVFVPRLSQVFLAGMRKGSKTASELALFAFERVQQLGSHLRMKDQHGEVVFDSADAFVPKAEVFLSEEVGILKKLRVFG